MYRKAGNSRPSGTFTAWRRGLRRRVVRKGPGPAKHHTPAQTRPTVLGQSTYSNVRYFPRRGSATIMPQIVSGSRLVLCGLRIGRRAQAVECGLEDWSGVAGAAVDRGDGDDHVEDLFKGKVVADFAGVLCGGQERPAGGDHPGAVVLEEGVAAVGLLEQFGGDVPLAGGKGGESVQPGHQSRSGRLAVDGLGGRADGIDFVGVEGLEELLASGKVAVEGRHADFGAPRDLGHRHLGIGIGERGPRDREDLVAVPLGVGAPGGCWVLNRHRDSKWTSYPFSSTVKWTGYPPTGPIVQGASSWNTGRWDAPASRSARCAW